MVGRQRSFVQRWPVGQGVLFHRPATHCSRLTESLHRRCPLVHSGFGTHLAPSQCVPVGHGSVSHRPLTQRSRAWRPMQRNAPLVQTGGGGSGVRSAACGSKGSAPKCSGWDSVEPSRTEGGGSAWGSQTGSKDGEVRFWQNPRKQTSLRAQRVLCQ